MNLHGVRTEKTPSKNTY